MGKLLNTNINGEFLKEKVVQWIREFFNENGQGCNAVIGISGGKDSSIVAGLCVEALGKNRVIGVLMPCGEQADIDMAQKLVEVLDIKSIVVNVEAAINGVLSNIPDEIIISNQAKINLPARIRMSTLYAVSQSVNGRVANTCNLSEDWVGYATRYGDAAGDFSPLSKLTVTQVKAIGYALKLPNDLVEKVPIDGLCGKTDEENLGFSYEVLDRYITKGICEEKDIKDKIDSMHAKNKFKLELMPSFELRD
ncbi:MAG: NAD(+) synthase [Aminipila sp.]